MYVTPEHGANLCMPPHKIQKRLGVAQSGRIEPCAAHGKRGMVHADQGVLTGMLLKSRFHSRQFG